MGDKLAVVFGAKTFDDHVSYIGSYEPSGIGQAHSIDGTHKW